MQSLSKADVARLCWII